MCGLTFITTKKKIKKSKILKLLSLMKNRGPDNQSYKEFKLGNRFLYFFHSRLSIIDLKKNSHQPFEKNKLLIIFNGEIYNYIELRGQLEKTGVRFETDLDTEVLLEAYRYWGSNFTNKLIGMWSVIIFDKSKNEILISRDNTNQKPLFFYRANYDEFIYASEIKYIYCIYSKIKKNLNTIKLKDDLVKGYRNWFVNDETFHKLVKKVNSFFNYKYSNLDKNKIILKKICSINLMKKKVTTNNYNFIKKKIRATILNSIDISLRSDVPLAYSLSGGVDSNLITCISKKIFCNNINTYSIIDKDPRYDKSKLIFKSCNDLEYNPNYINIKKYNHFRELKKLIKYYSYPVPTINFLIQSYLVGKIKKDNIKVLISGNGADELFTGYYHHYLLYFKNSKHLKYKKNFLFWSRNVLPHIRNSLFKEVKNDINREKLFSNNRHFFKNRINLINMHNVCEYNFNFSKLRNRMLNEYFFETVPVITFAEDLNCMRHSIENRNPFLNQDLLNYIIRLPDKYLVQKGFLKFLIRDSFRDIMPKYIINNYRKTGFNFSFRTLFSPNDKDILLFLQKDLLLYKWFDKKLIKFLFKRKILTDEENKFMFSFLSNKLYLDAHYQ